MSQPTEKTIAESLPGLKLHLRRTLSIHLLQRYPVEDLVQDTYVRAIQKLDTLQHTNRAAVTTWLQRIAHRLVIDKVREKQSQQVHGAEASAIYSTLTASAQLTPSTECSAIEGIRRVEVALADVNPEYRTVLKLRYCDQLTFVQIAEQLGRSSSSVWGLHRNALRSLRCRMGRSSLFFFR